MSDIQISCVSGTFNRMPLLRRMIQSVRRSAGVLPYELVIVDGGSTDGSLEWLKQQKDVVLIEHGELRGGIKAFNDGFRKSQGQYVAALNDDIVVESDSLRRACNFLQEHPEAGQVAFGHRYQNRAGDKTKPRVQGAFGYYYGQCCVTRRWLGDLAGWWGDEGMLTYGGDTRLGLRVWELGYQVAKVPRCTVIDWEHEDELRVWNNERLRGDNGGVHPDLTRFGEVWKGRMPPRAKWRPAKVNRVYWKAHRGTLRTLRFKAMMAIHHQMRHGCIDELSHHGPSKQLNQSAAYKKLGLGGYQPWVINRVREYRPDLVMLQAQRPNNIMPETARALKAAFPETLFINWDADVHYPLNPFQFEIAQAVDLQLLPSPDLFTEYRKQGAKNIGWWPISVEQDYLDASRQGFQESSSLDIVFLGNLYGIGTYPEATMRRDAFLAIHHSSLNARVWGGGWKKVGIKSAYTGEQHGRSATIYTKAKMALSISQTRDLRGYTSDRLYNICATGCPAVVQHFVGMEDHGFVDGKTCIVFRTIPEMLEKIHYYTAHPQEREAIGRAGKLEVATNHTWEVRVQTLFEMLAGLEY